MSSLEKESVKVMARNREAYHEYFVEEEFEAGIELCGTEVKSIRAGTLNLKDAWCGIKNGEMILNQMHISPYKAPQSVYNFIDLCNHNFYDGLIFHRVIPGFMIQGGCPDGTGMGGPGYCIKGEFFFNGVKNELKHKRGVLSMARSSSPNSAGSQFFIMHQDAKHLDGQYAAFGKVTSGMDVVDAIASTKTGPNDRPVAEQKIASITVDTHGETYPEPKKLPDPYGRF